MKKRFRILVLDNTRDPISWGARNIVRECAQSAPLGAEIWVRRPPHSDLPPYDFKFDALVISGSATSCLEMREPWITAYDEFVTAEIKKRTPILGVCYGHQTLVRCIAKLQGEEPKLRKSPTPEFGWREIEIQSPSALFHSLSTRFTTYESHYEEVAELPGGCEALAKNDRCNFQAFEFKDAPVFGIQFHPEYTCEDAENSMADKIKNGVPREWIFNAGKGKKLYDPKIGKTIFGNFFEIGRKYID